MWARATDGPGVASRDPRRFAVPLPCLAVVLLLPACFQAPPTAPLSAKSIELVSGGGQSGTPGYRLDNEVTLRVRDDAGHPRAGVVVTFTPDDPFAYAEPDIDTTDQDGIARTAWRLGAVLGEQHLSAQATTTQSSDPANVSATASSASVLSISGDYSGWCMVSTAGVRTCTVPPGLKQPNPPFPGTAVAPGTAFTEVATRLVGDPGGCAVTSAGRIWCFDRAADGSITNSAELSGSYPPLHGLVGANTSAMCALAADGVGCCWGGNRFGMLGVSDLNDRSTPTPLATTQRFTAIVLDWQNGCGLTGGGAAYCWGWNSGGEAVAVPGRDNVLVPTPVPTTERFRQLGFIASLWNASCGIRITGGLVCWGVTPGLFGRDASFGAMAAAVVGGETVVGMQSIQSLTVLLMQDGGLSLVGEVYLDVWAGVPYPALAASGGFLRELRPGSSRSLLCGLARGGTGILCQPKLRMAYVPRGLIGWSVPGVSGSTMPLYEPAVIGIPLR